MKCRICGKEISEPVYPLHMKRCKPKVEKVEEEIEQLNEKYLLEKTNDELKTILKRNDKPIYGNKEELVARIVGE